MFTFTDDEQIRAFVRLWNQFSQLEQQLAGYQVDVSKAYTLDPERKVLIEASASK